MSSEASSALCRDNFCEARSDLSAGKGRNNQGREVTTSPRIICGNCLDVMGEMQDGCIDLTVTSPPYDNLRQYKGYTFDFEAIARQLYRVTKKGGVVVWVVGDATINGSETGTSFKQALFFKEIGFNLHDTMIYEKTAGATGSNNAYWQSFEFMLVLSKGNPKSVNLIKDRKNITPPRSRTESAGHRKQDGEKKGRRIIVRAEIGIRNNIWRLNAGSLIKSNHPAPFPEALAGDHIRSWSNEGDLVYDPMGGSGTVAKMAQILNRRWIMSEISEEYCEIARKRLAPIIAQGSLL